MGYDYHITRDIEKFEFAKGLLDRAIHAVALSNFEFEYLWAMASSRYEFLYCEVSSQRFFSHKEGIRETAAELANYNREEAANAMNRLKHIYSSELGIARCEGFVPNQ